MKPRTAKPIAAPKHVESRMSLGSLTLGEVVLLRRLSRGGLTMPEAIRVVGAKGNGSTIAGLVRAFDAALMDSLPIAGRVRCLNCGGLLVSVPCLVCRDKKPESYRVSRYAGKL